MHSRPRWRRLALVGFLMLSVAIGLYFWGSFRTLTAIRSEPLPGTVLFPRPSPDGQFLTFMDHNAELVRIMDVASGTVRELGRGGAGGAKWSADGKYLYVPGADGTDTIYGPGMGVALEIPETLHLWWAADGPWFAVREPDRSISLRRVNGEAAPVPLFAAGVDPLVVNGAGASLGIRKNNGWLELLQVEHPGAAAQVVAREIMWIAAAPHGRAWIFRSKDDRLELQRDGEAPRELIPPGQFDLYRGAWSPDGKWVALIGTNVDREYEGLLFSADGVRKSLKLGTLDGVEGLDEVLQPIRWMPDSQSFVFVTFYRPREVRKAHWVHRVDVASGRERVWRLPYTGRNALRDFQFVGDGAVVATLDETLYWFDLE